MDCKSSCQRILQISQSIFKFYYIFVKVHLPSHGFQEVSFHRNGISGVIRFILLPRASKKGAGDVWQCGCYRKCSEVNSQIQDNKLLQVFKSAGLCWPTCLQVEQSTSFQLNSSWLVLGNFVTAYLKKMAYSYYILKDFQRNQTIRKEGDNSPSMFTRSVATLATFRACHKRVFHP